MFQQANRSKKIFILGLTKISKIQNFNKQAWYWYYCKIRNL